MWTCHGETFKRDRLKGCTIRLMAEIASRSSK